MTVIISGSAGIQNVLGSAAAPAESNTTSSNTGMYFPTSTTLGFSTAGTNAVTVDASQNVGIGTTTPSTGTLNKQLTINSGASALAGVVLQNNTTGTGSTDGTVFYINSADAALINYETGNLQFGTAGTERARIDSSGNLLVGVTSGALHTLSKSYASFYAAQITNTSATSPYSLLLSLSGVSGGTGGGFLTCSDGANRLIITGNGNVANVNNSYGAISDIKLKENIVDATPKLANLMQVRVVNYNLKTELGYDSDKKIGVIAQELEQVFPNMVEETPDKDADNNDLGTTTKSVKYSVFVPMLIKAIQEQQALITQLTDRIAALEAK